LKISLAASSRKLEVLDSYFFKFESTLESLELFLAGRGISVTFS
jgi:hypothetical protein